MVKKFSVLICMIFALVVLLCPAYGSDYGHIFDYAGLFSADEASALDAEIDWYVSCYEMDVVILTESDTQGQESLAYADDFYDYNEFGLGEDEAGILYFIDMDNRVPTISTKGVMIDYITDGRLEALLDEVHPYLVDGDYAGSVWAFLELLEVCLDEGIPAGHERIDGDGGDDYVYGDEYDSYQSYGWWFYYDLDSFDILVTLVVMALIFCIYFFGVRARYEMRGSAYRYDVRANATMRVTGRQDTFINRTVSVRELPKNDSGNDNDSTTHESDSGDTHGGGSGSRF